MRLTNKLFAQHLGWTFKKHWQIQGKRVPRETGASAELKQLGIPIKNVQDITFPKRTPDIIEIVGSLPKPTREDSTHPNWHNTACRIYGDGNVLLEGIPQAQVLLNTVVIEGLPRYIEEVVKKQQISSNVDRNVQNAIMAAHVFDAEQVKLPKVRLSDRPAFNLPRQYGISAERRNRLLINKLLHECQKLAGASVSLRHGLVNNAHLKTTLTRENDLVQFDVTADFLLTSSRPIDSVKGKFDGSLPDLFPMKCTITIPKKHIYIDESFYPISSAIKCSHPHTIFLHFNKEIVGNLHGLGVSETQLQSRTLMKAFTTAAARAKQLNTGISSNGTLTKPIVVQSVQTDGRVFHFGVLQLNTLDLVGSSGVRNYWFNLPNLNLFTDCGYRTGRPYLDGFNKDIFRMLNAFYNS